MRLSGMEEEAMTKAGDKAYRATPSSHHLTIFISFPFHLSRLMNHYLIQLTVATET
jgi:hypothetical protein